MLVAAYAPEAERGSGHGPCFVSIEARSSSGNLPGKLTNLLKDKFRSKKIRVLVSLLYWQPLERDPPNESSTIDKASLLLIFSASTSRTKNLSKA